MERGVTVSKTRKMGGHRSAMTKTPIHEGRESKRERTWDTTSETASVHMAAQHRQAENTFRLTPHPERRFQPKKAEYLMQETLKEFLTDVEYDKTLGQRMSKLLSDTIKTRLKEFKWTRYKTVVHVVIGENKDQDIRAGSRFLWNTETDTYASAYYANRSLFALAVTFGVYFE